MKALSVAAVAIAATGAAAIGVSVYKEYTAPPVAQASFAAVSQATASPLIAMDWGFETFGRYENLVGAPVLYELLIDGRVVYSGTQNVTGNLASKLWRVNVPVDQFFGHELTGRLTVGTDQPLAVTWITLPFAFTPLDAGTEGLQP